MPGFVYGPKAQFFDDNGVPLVGGKVYIYEPNQFSITEDSYDDWDNAVAGILPQDNPIILDARGECTIIITTAIALKLTDSSDTQIWTVPYFDVADA